MSNEKDNLRKNFMDEEGRCYVPVAISNRHIHLCEEHVEILFGKGYNLTVFKDLSQPGQYACNEKVTVVGSKNSIDGVRILGPARSKTQVEISVTDSFMLGIPVAVRMSGELDSTPGCKLIGPCGEVTLNEGVVVSARHLHISVDEAEVFGLKNGDKIKLKKGGLRPVVFEDVLVRCGDGHHLEVHIDTDEGNAAVIKNGEKVLFEKM